MFLTLCIANYVLSIDVPYEVIHLLSTNMLEKSHPSSSEYFNSELNWKFIMSHFRSRVVHLLFCLCTAIHPSTSTGIQTFLTTALLRRWELNLFCGSTHNLWLLHLPKPMKVAKLQYMYVVGRLPTV